MNRLRRDLRAIAADGAASSLMVGIGETYLPAFVLAVSHSQLACGLTATVPLVIGGVLQLATPLALTWFRSYRTWVVLCAAVQALSFLPLIAAATLGAMPVALAFAAIAIYWATGQGSGSAWNAWVGCVVPEHIRARYFAGRTVLCQAGVLLGILAGGFSLQWGAQTDHTLVAFAAIFLTAVAARLVSTWVLSGQSEPSGPQGDVLSIDWQELRAELGRNSLGRVLVYLLVAQAAVQVSGPYFTPFMLGQLQFSYAQYVVLISVAYVAKIAALPLLGWVADRFGVRRLLWLGAVAIVPLAGLWNVSGNFAYLCGVQALSGAAWGAFELASLLLFFDAIPRRRRVITLTLFNLANSCAILIGSLGGAALLHWFGSTRESYLLLFMVSSAARALTVCVLIGLPAEKVPEPALPQLRPDAAMPTYEAADPQPIEPATALASQRRAA